MKIFPVIYSRILKDDYPNEFLVRPDDLDILTAEKYVIYAMENILHVGGIRHAVFSVGNYLIYGGVSCVASSFVERILKTQNIDFSYEEYMVDKAGRPMIFFIGFAVDKDTLIRDELPDINLYETYSIYLSYLKKQWNNENAKTEISESIELKTRQYMKKLAPSSLRVGKINILRNYCEDDFQEIIDYYFSEMAWGNRGDFSFLSNVILDDVEKSPFANISIYDGTPEEYARRMEVSEKKSSYVQKSSHNESEFRTNNILNTKVEGEVDRGSEVVSSSIKSGKKKTQSTHYNKKKSATAIGALVLAIAIIVLLVLVLKFKVVNADQRNQIRQETRRSTTLELME